jgi:hypothetical protein
MLLVAAVGLAAPQPSAAAPAASSAASAAPATLGPDEVLLRDGGFVRGTLIEVDPGQRVVIVPADGAPREISWSEILRVERGKHADGSPTTAAETAPATGRPRVHLEVSAGKSVQLYEIDGEARARGTAGPAYGMSYRSVCRSPCGVIVDGTRGQDFFLARDLVTASRRFKLDQSRGDVVLRVRAGSRALRILGGVALGLGVAGAVAGALFTIGDGTRVAGYALLGAGGAGIAAGVPMIVFGRTRWELVGSRSATGRAGRRRCRPRRRRCCPTRCCSRTDPLHRSGTRMDRTPH